ncbi:MAG: hypothetical protein HQL48_08315 [Gammaproteobacteria bacterium]|nr:hypothetical protein [Gammaproteobacteria bacterium]
MPLILGAGIVLAQFFLAGSVFAADRDSPQLAIIKYLGALNGVAMQCGQLAQIQRIKRALVWRLPKQRALGALYDAESQRSFLAFASQKERCPDETDFATSVAIGLQQLTEQFPQESEQ